jgi:hypothetical protein
MMKRWIRSYFIRLVQINKDKYVVIMTPEILDLIERLKGVRGDAKRTEVVKEWFYEQHPKLRPQAGK